MSDFKNPKFAELRDSAKQHAYYGAIYESSG